ncbi:MAG: CHAT domain-containing protein [Chloroflexi bacterium]|nr:CHAT domain-containing protein [Chloroflexota bacterium]
MHRHLVSFISVSLSGRFQLIGCHKLSQLSRDTTNPDGSLLFSPQEVAAVLSYFPPDQSKALRGQAATQQAVRQNLPQYPVLHFSTHGWAGWQEPLKSGLLMAGDPPLTLGDILELRLERSRLAVLSACETGIPGTKLPDEVISLPAGLMQAGVAGVAASLWSVNDLSTAMLMERFYRLWRADGLVPALALREAQRWVRDTTNREKADYFQRDVPVLAQIRMPALTAASFFTDMMIQKQLDARGLAHPFWWAAFCLTGV